MNIHAINRYLWGNWLPLTIIIATLVIRMLGDPLHINLRFDRIAIAEGELWRLLSAHFVHLSWTHLLMNLVGLSVVYIFFGRLLSTLQWLLAILFSALVTSLLIYVFNSSLLWYVGLSGLLHGLFVVGGLADSRVRPLEGWIFLLLVSAKLLWEQLYGPLPGSEQSAGGPVLVDAHLYGALSGLLFWLLSRKVIEKRLRTQKSGAD